jgi:hypothetical protein
MAKELEFECEGKGFKFSFLKPIYLPSEVGLA